ncbi:alpha/beta hydrolase [Aquimarina sediminis]|uniref:alpha/beta hydrolase n=1 Tax=Aquimarina sediminis TaxID=2070536 RepID=UPI000CA0516A|nr:alpha/beta hydrolase [Aquimarina sediminis]
MSRLIILSDLWGKKKSHWIDFYIKELKDHFDITYYDCCELGNVDTSTYTEENIHKQFVNGRISTAVQNLLRLQKSKIHILAFSVGGVIAWKSAIENPNICTIFSVSSTRLRYETTKPKGKIQLYFGQNDIYKPEEKWFTKMDLDINIEDNTGHLVYTDPRFAKKLCDQIIMQKGEI